MNNDSKPAFSTVDEYLDLLPEASRARLQLMRETIRAAAPEAEECISYQMPAVKFHGMLVYYAAFKKHYSLFPMTGVLKDFADRLTPYVVGKGTIQFKYDEPFPAGLITEIVQYRLHANMEKYLAKAAGKKKA